MDQDPGQVIADRYVLGQRLGRGGMADVYLGTDRVLGRTVAVKVLAPSYADQPAFVDRFRHEARTAARLNHPNIVGVHDTGSEGDLHYIVMEHVEGRTLRDIIDAYGRLPPNWALAVAQKVCGALAVAHAAGLVHRDIKPSNIMINDDGQVKVADFGIARATEEDTTTQPGVILGSAAYLSPEQASGGDLDARSDLYGLGCVVYEMLTGQTPFTGESAVALAIQHVERDPYPPSMLRPELDPTLDALIERAIAKDPADRFQSAAEMSQAIARTADVVAPRAVAPGQTQAIAPVVRDPTQVMQPVPPPPQSTQLMGPAPGYPPAVWPPEQTVIYADERRRLGCGGWFLIFLGVATLVGGVILAVLLSGGLDGIFGGDDDPTRDPTGGATTPGSPSASASASPSPSASASPSPSPPPQPDLVEQARGALVEELAAGRDAGEYHRSVSDEIYAVALRAIDQWADGEIEEAFDTIDEARELTAQHYNEGRISSEGRARAIIGDLDGLRQAMAEQPPPEDD